MRQILRHWRVIGATLFSVGFVIGAYVLAKSVEAPPAALASEESALLAAIAKKDSDGDGLPDWEEALYGTSPSMTDTFKLGMTDGEAVARGLIVPKAIADVTVITSSPATALFDDPSLPAPPADGTLTAAFAENFFTLYLAAKQEKGGANLSEADMQDIASRALNSLAEIITAAPDFKSAKDIIIAGSGPEALADYAVKAEAILLKNTSNATTSELNYLKYAVEGDDEALTRIASIAKAYRDSAVGLAVLPAPRELADDHLLLVNALMRVSQIATDFTRVNTDVLATILALEQYPQATGALGTAFINIGKVYMQAGISLPAGEPGASFVNLIADLVSEQAAAKKL